MKKQYIKMNIDDNYLSLGNLFRLIKELSQNKISAMQTELFCTLFQIDEINDTTVNNYVTGYRGIGGEYKQRIVYLYKRYNDDKDVFNDICLSIISIMDGVVYRDINDLNEFINNNNRFIDLINRLYNICKNDNNVNSDLVSCIYRYITNKNYYSAFVEMFRYIVLENKQPLYEEDLKKEVIDTVLQDTYISANDLEKYLSLKLKESINYEFTLKKMALDGNAYAAFEMASLEYNGYLKGYPRYEEAYRYLSIASKSNHPGALYMIGNMYYKGYIGNNSNEDYEKGYKYLVKAKELGNIAACNVLGLYYYNGINPLKKNINKALELFKIGADNNYAYSYNNLGKYYELNKEYNKAIDCYEKSASLGESWACNKVGEIYRKGIWLDKDLKKAYYYYNQAILVNHRVLCYYAYYNLGVLYYVGDIESNISKDMDKAIDCLEIASDNNIIEASIMLLKIYVKEYNSKKDIMYIDLINKYKSIVEKHEKYDDEIKKDIEEELNSIKKYDKINIEW